MIVTGASSGIGRALALAAARDAFDLVISARRAERLEQVAEHIRAAGAQCAVVIGDVTDPQIQQKLIDTAIERFGRIDVLVNNAGGGQPGPLLAQTDEGIESQWQTHVLAPLRTSRAALPHLRKTQGQLMFVGSGLARFPMPNGGAYSLAKAAVRAAAIQLRRELRSEGIAVTYIDPGLVKTEFSEVAGMRGESQRFAANVDVVAQRILRTTHTRPDRINAIPLHTFAATLGEWFPKTGEWVTRNMLGRKDEPPATPLPREESAGVPALEKTKTVEPQVAEPYVEHSQDGEATFEKALEPVAHRMNRVKLPQDFVRNLLQSNTEIKLQDAAMQWAGMPNKNERAALQEVLQTLAAAGFLKPTGEESWIVVHTP